MTILCDNGDDEWGWVYNITHVKASHPFFECMNGCTPLPNDDPDALGSWLTLSKNGTGTMLITFSNKTNISFLNDDNAVQANLLAACAGAEAHNQVYNIAVGERTDLEQLFRKLKQSLAKNGVRYAKTPRYRDFRPGDVHHSLADIGKAQRLLGYAPQYDLQAGIAQAMPWYIAQNLAPAPSSSWPHTQLAAR